MKRAAGFLAALVLVWGLAMPCWGVELALTSHAALLMEKTTGQILYAQNEHEALPPASVTKIMTVLLTMEAIDSGRIALDDVVTVSAYAAGMGGSQVFLAEGEQITVDDLLKGVCVSSGNDAAVALAEHVAGVTELFVEQMNNRARELGMNDTHFVNCTGLAAEGHVTSAHDIALMSRELLLHHPEVRNYTTIWMDTLRNGTFGLNNTNKLIRFYDGATGLKTGFTREAGYCISATAERDGMELIAVIMKGNTSDSRNADAKALLNYGFSTYALVDIQPEKPLPVLPVVLGTADTVSAVLPEEGRTLLLEKSQTGGLTQTVELPEAVTAPVCAGDRLGTLTVSREGTVALAIPITIASSMVSIITLIDTSLVQGQLQNALGYSLDETRALYGNYSACMDLYNLPSSLMVALTASVIPAVSASITQHNEKQTARIVRSSFRITALLAFPMGLGLWALSGPIFRLFYPRYDGVLGGQLLSVLGIASIFVCLMLITNSILQSYGRVNVPILTMLIGGVVKIALNYNLTAIPSVNIHGAPIGTLVCFALTAILNLIAVSRAASFRLNYPGYFLRPLLASLAMAFTARGVYALCAHLLLSEGSGRGMLLLCVGAAIAAAVIVYVVLVLALRILTHDDLALLPKGDKLARVLHVR